MESPIDAVAYLVFQHISSLRSRRQLGSKLDGSHVVVVVVVISEKY